MNARQSPPSAGADEEIAALIETLHRTEERLEELTAGEVDTVADRNGRTLLLRHAQDHLRQSEAAKQAAILNALPAHIALLDSRGCIVSVNDAWRRFASANALQGPVSAIGLNYLETCDRAKGDDAVEAGQVARGIRSVLEGGSNQFSIEYPCDSPDESRWFLLTVTPLGKDHAHGVVVMHLDISERKHADEEIRRYAEQLKTAIMSTVEVATIISEMRDPYTTGHERRVAALAVAIGAELGFNARGQEGLRVAGYLHDIGKITIPSEILSKPGKISKVEYQLIQGHAQASYDVLKGVEFPWPVAQIALQHHERMDGSGYPQGLKGEAILLEARIMAVADVVEAMSSHRPYRPALGIAVALAEIERGRGTAYDADAVDACLRLFSEKHYAIPG